MSDQQTYTHIDGSKIRIKPAEYQADLLVISASFQGNTGTSFIAPAKLLAMIDAADPEAMRAYLRETFEQLDRSTGAGIYGTPLIDTDALTVMLDRALRGFNGTGLTDPDLPRALALGVAEQLADEPLALAPEADSPEDVDDTRRLCDPITAEQLADLRESGRTLGEAWRNFTDAVREGMQR